MPRNLILAYVATWLIHGSYITYLLARSRKLKGRSQDHERS